MGGGLCVIARYFYYCFQYCRCQIKIYLIKSIINCWCCNAFQFVFIFNNAVAVLNRKSRVFIEDIR